MSKFTYNDIVKLRAGPAHGTRNGRAWVVGIFESRPGAYFDKFPSGVVYTIEFEDGSSDQFHEDDLIAESEDKTTQNEVGPIGQKS